MTSRTSRMTRWQMLCSVAALMLLGGLSGCVFGEESDPPVLTVDLYWQYDLRTGHDWDCHTVPVAAAEWHLRNSEGDEVHKLDRDKNACDDRINFFDLDIGKYELEVAGYNDAGDKAWEALCPLELDRFDSLYQCTINQLEQ